MSVVDVQNANAEKVSQVELVESIFNVPVKKSVLHEVVTMQLSCKRAGTASVKRRSDVKGSRRKLFRQKGTGRARSGDIKSPLLRGGGVIFGPENRDYSYSVPKKVKKLALKMALTSKLQKDELIVIDKIALENIKTKDLKKIMSGLNIENALIVTEVKDENLELSARNIPNVKVLRTDGLNVYDILKYQKLIMIESSIKSIEGRLLT